MKHFWSRLGGGPKVPSTTREGEDHGGPLINGAASQPTTAQQHEGQRRFPQAARLEALRERVLTLDAASLPRPNLSLSAITTPTNSEEELSERSERAQSKADKATSVDDAECDGAYAGEGSESFYQDTDDTGGYMSSAYEDVEGAPPPLQTDAEPPPPSVLQQGQEDDDNYLITFTADSTHVSKVDTRSDDIYLYHDVEHDGDETSQFHIDGGVGGGRDNDADGGEMKAQETNDAMQKNENADSIVSDEDVARALVYSVNTEPGPTTQSTTSSNREDENEEEDDDGTPGSAYWAESTRGWTERFREATETLRMMSSNAPFAQRIAATNRLTQLSRDFLLSARTYGKIIISEAFMPAHLKTIQPVAIGGIAGGTKYLVRDILFKFSMDSRGLYQSDDAAAKLAGHELKGVMAYYNCHIPSLHTPMTAVIDFRGFRLLAVSLLPISPGTLCYGSPDAGHTVVNTNPVLDAKMREAAQKLNIKEHMVYPHPLSGIPPLRLATAADVEGHHINGQFYLVDLSRVFPPEAPNARYPLFRLAAIGAGKGTDAGLSRLPELVKRFPTPLCSDAFSGFVSASKQDLAEHNKEVREATDYLHQEVIPKFARKLTARVAYEWTIFARKSDTDVKGQEKEKPSRTVFLAMFPLKQLLHAKGINLRNLGRVRHMVGQLVPPDTPGLTDTRQLLFLEMCARTIRKIVFAKLRQRMKKLRVPLEEPYREVYLHYLNKLFVPLADRDIRYFNGPLKSAIMKKFGTDALDAHEKRDDFNLLGLLVPQRTASERLEGLGEKKANTKAKHGKRSGSSREKKAQKPAAMAAVPSGDEAHLADGRPLLLLRLLALLQVKLTKDTVENFLTEVREKEFALTRFDSIDLAAIHERVKHLGIIGHSRGYIYKMKALQRRDNKRCERLLHKALKCFEEVLESNPANKITLRNAGQICMHLDMIDQDEQHAPVFKSKPSTADLDRPLMRRARDYFAQSVRADPQDTYSLYQYACFLKRCGDQVKAVDYLLRAVEADPTHMAALSEVYRYLRDNGYNHDAEVVLELSETVDKVVMAAKTGK